MALARDLQRLGVVPGDVVMVHASLRVIGPVAHRSTGGALGVIEALEAAVGPEGTLLMMISAEDPCGEINQRPEGERAALLEATEPFDALRTPAEPDVGYLAEAFRTVPGTLVTDHPEGRFAARGARASELVRDPPWDDYYGPRSALDRLVAMSGRVLRLGADEDTVTLLHYAEYLVELPGKRRVRRHRRVLEGGRPVVRTIECLDDCEGIVPFEGGDYFGAILRAYLGAGHGAHGTVGNARSELLDARDFVAFGVRWMAEHLASSAR